MPDIYNRIRKTACNLTPCIHGAKLQESSEISGKNPDDLLDFSVNLNPLGIPYRLKKHITLKDIDKYPDNRYIEFKEAAASYIGVKPENIIPGNGSSELIRLFAETVIESGDKVIIPNPTFSEYEFQCRLFGAEIEYVNYKNIVDIEIKPEYKAVFLCNPNNPTGNLIKKEKVLELAEKCEKNGVFLFVDEAFIELSNPEESIAKHSSDFVFILRSITKSHGVPGLRIGFAVASEKFAQILNNVRLHWNINTVSILAGIFLFKNSKNYIEDSLKVIEKERKWLSSKISLIRGFKPYQSDTNFILIDMNEFLINSKEFTNRMLKHGIIIRECSSFSLENHVRIGVKKRSQNKKLIAAISDVITEWGKELAKKEINTVLERGITSRSRLSCEYYPCHFEGQDCTFCFCPFYPCKNEKTGGKFIQKSTGGTVWSCLKCWLIHRGEIADKVLLELMKKKKIQEVWKTVMESELD